MAAKINDALSAEVAEAVRVNEIESISDVVYDAYTPKVYIRRYSDGGLIDERNMTARLVSDGKLAVTNDTQPNPNYRHTALGNRTVAQAVETGRGYQFYSPGARPFTAETVNALKRNREHVAALRAGLRRQNIDCQ